MKFNNFSSTPGRVMVHIGLVLVQWFKSSPCGPVMKLPLLKNVWIRIRVRYNPRNKTKFGLFQCKYTLSKENMTVYIIKRRIISLYFVLSIQIWLFRWISKGVGRHQYVLNFKHVWICSERGGWYFSKMSEIQKCLNYPRVGVKSNWEFVPNFPVFF